MNTAEPQPAAPASQIVVADATPVLLHGLVGVLRAAGYEVTGAATVTELRESLGKQPPDLVLLDVRLLADDDAVCAAARDQGISVVVTVADPDDRVLELVNEGVNGLWDREGDVGELRRVVTGALAGSPVVSPDVGAALLERIAGAGRAGRETVGQLTSREQEILGHMADGKGNRAIADALFISENTVRNHVRNVLDKLQARTRTEAVVRAVRAGLIRLG